MNVSHLYEYLAVTLNHVSGDFALTGAAACRACGTGRYNSDANSSTVCVDHRTCSAGNYTIVPGNNTLNQMCDQCVGGHYVQRSQITNTTVLERCTNCVARQCAEGEGVTNCTFCPLGLYTDAVGSTNCTLCAAELY